MKRPKRYKWQRILDHLATLDAGAFGLDICEATGISRGEIYVLLSGLEDDGAVDSWVPAERQPLGIVRRKYIITPHGRTLCEQQTKD